MFKFFKKSKPITKPAPELRTYEVHFTSRAGTKCVAYVNATSSSDAEKRIIGAELYDSRKYLTNNRRDYSVNVLYVEYAILAKGC